MNTISPDSKLRKLLRDLGFINLNDHYSRAFFDDLVDFGKSRNLHEQTSRGAKSSFTRTVALVKAHEYVDSLGRGRRYWAKGRSLRPLRVEYPRDSLWISQKVMELLIHIQKNYPQLLHVSRHNGSEDDRRPELRLSAPVESPVKASEPRELLRPKKRHPLPTSGVKRALELDDVESDTTQGRLLPLASTQPLSAQLVPFRPTWTQSVPVQSVLTPPTSTETPLSVSSNGSSISPRRSTRQRRAIQRDSMVSTVEAIKNMEENGDDIQVIAKPLGFDELKSPKKPRKKDAKVLKSCSSQILSTVIEVGDDEPRLDVGYDEEAVLHRVLNKLAEIDPEWVRARS